MWNAFYPLVIVFTQLLFGNVMFLLKAPRRRDFIIRSPISVAVSVGLIAAYAAIQTVADVFFLNMFGFVLLLTGCAVSACWKISAVSIVFVSTSAYILQHVAVTLDTVFFEWIIRLSPETSPRVLSCHLILIISVYFLFIRKNGYIYNSVDVKQA